MYLVRLAHITSLPVSFLFLVPTFFSPDRAALIDFIEETSRLEEAVTPVARANAARSIYERYVVSGQLADATAGLPRDALAAAEAALDTRPLSAFADICRVVAVQLEGFVPRFGASLHHADMRETLAVFACFTPMLGAHQALLDPEASAGRSSSSLLPHLQLADRPAVEAGLGAFVAAARESMSHSVSPLEQRTQKYAENVFVLIDRLWSMGIGDGADEGGDSYAAYTERMMRRGAVSAWLALVVSEASARQADAFADAGNYLKAIYVYLLARQIPHACRLAVAHRDFRLATLIAQVCVRVCVVRMQCGFGA